MFKQKIARGVKLLDRERPGWHRKVKLTTLDMHSGYIFKPSDCGCVLAQISPRGSYAAESNALFDPDGKTPYEEYHKRQIENGFDIDTTPRGQTYESAFAILTQEWKDAIRARRSRGRSA